MTRILDLELSGLRLPADRGLPPRDRVGQAAFHDAAFLARYDDRTLIYDCFEAAEGITFLCPPLLNLKPLLAEAEIRVDGRPATIREIRDLSRCSIVVLSVATGGTVTVGHRDFGANLAVGCDHTETFAGLNALYTISLDNRLDWIRDWLDYYVRVHGAEAVVLADNGSTAYGPADLRAMLASVEGLKAAAILRARYPFGPTAENKTAYDALFLQRALAELGRRRFLGRARAVLNVDIDELFHSRTGRSVFDATVASVAGYLRADAEWVYAVGVEGPARHRDHGHVSATGRPKANRKWCVVPDGPQAGRQWLTHFLGSRKDPVDPDFVMWHFRQVSTSWKADRSAGDLALVPDPDLTAAMDRAFPPDAATAAPAKDRADV